MAAPLRPVCLPGVSCRVAAAIARHVARQRRPIGMSGGTLPPDTSRGPRHDRTRSGRGLVGSAFRLRTAVGGRQSDRPPFCILGMVHVVHRFMSIFAPVHF